MPRETLQSLRDRRVVLLFFRDYEVDKFIPGDRYLKRLVRPLYNLLHHRQKRYGFAVSFDLLRRALERSGHEVRVNDYRTARACPAYPVGLVGNPPLLEGWSLPNPAVLGPSLHDHPSIAPDLIRDPRYRRYACLGPWTEAMFRPVYGDACFGWFAGIDLAEWPDLSAGPKTHDVLVYDKIRWEHDALEASLLRPALAALEARGLTWQMVRYRMHDHAMFRRLLAQSRSMLFLCEHETQGLAYQEAMASGLPILAWDPGVWVDPQWRRHTAVQPAACSVPFFGPECGETFRDMDAFPAALDRFVVRLPGYRPREFVARALSLEASAAIYAGQYFGLVD